MGPKRIKKAGKKAFFAPVWLPSPLLCAKKSFNSFELPATWPHISGISVPTLLSPNWPCLADCPWRQTVWIFLIFQQKIFLWHHQITSYFLYFSRNDRFLLQIWSRSKNGLRNSRSIFTVRFQKNVFIAIPFSLLEASSNTRTQLFKCPM